MGAPLEDARHLAQRYERMRQEAEAQVFLNNFILFFKCVQFLLKVSVMFNLFFFFLSFFFWLSFCFN